jgi:hypothetical protein
MSNEDLQTRYNNLLRLVGAMRIAQGEYLQHRYPTLLEKARRAQRKVDEFVSSENKARAAKQGEIFTPGP